MSWKPEVSKEEVMGVLREAIDLGLEWVNFSGGELLLFKRWVLDLITWLRSEDVEPSLVTNAMFVTDSISKELARSKAHVYVSLDGNQQTHELIRGKGTWKATISGITKLREKNVKVTTVMAIGTLNYNAVKDFVRISRELGVDSVAIIPVMPFGNALKNKIWIDKDRYIKALKDFEEAVESESLHGSIWCTPWAKNVVKSKRLHTGNCRKQRGLDLAPDGSVLLCDVLDVKLGNVRVKPLREVWSDYLNNPLIKRISSPSGTFCSSCPYYLNCLGGCYARALQAFNRLEGDPLCPFLNSNQKEVRKVS